jgi:hypothetical protein
VTRDEAALSREARHEIGMLNEKPLHAALKTWYAQPGDLTEIEVDGFVIDIVRGDLLVEIQTRHFSAIKRKMIELVENHRVRLVYPVAREKWIVRLAKDGGKGVLGRRKSPKRGSKASLFAELVSFPKLLAHSNLSIEVLLIQEEEVRAFGSKRAWRRRGWVVQERRLLDVVDRHLFEDPVDLLALVPSDLPQPWTTADLAQAVHRPRRLAQQMAYCLRHLGLAESVGKEGNAILYETRGPG